MPKKEHLAFRQNYSGIAKQLTTAVYVSSVSTSNPDLLDKRFQIVALWDTGASSSVITPKIKKQLELFSVGDIQISGVNSLSRAETVEIAILLPNKVEIEGLMVIVAELNAPGVDMLIGMDIIGLGDFSISNGENSTLFSFAVPPFTNKVDLLEKAEVSNSDQSSLFDL